MQWLHRVSQLKNGINSNINMADQKQGGISEKKMEKIVSRILVGMLVVVVVVLLSLRAYEEVIKEQQRKAKIENQD